MSSVPGVIVANNIRCQIATEINRSIIFGVFFPCGIFLSSTEQSNGEWKTQKTKAEYEDFTLIGQHTNNILYDLVQWTS